MTEIATVPPRRVGRPCSVCALPAPQRTHLEVSLAQGVTISRLSRQRGAPSRHSIARHVMSGHLPRALEDQAVRAQGLDFTSIAARINDIARRARTSALEAAEAGNAAALARANASELRALMALVAVSGPDASEVEIQTDADARAIARAVFAVAKDDAHVAESIGRMLENMGHGTAAEDVFDQTSRNEIEQ